MEADRKKEVVKICLDHFIEKGLSEASTRSLSSALQLQSGGLYYYFSSKDEAVMLCAEEAALRFENALIPPVLEEIDAPDLMMKHLQARADEMAPTMRFLVSVCASKRYRQSVRPILDRLSDRYEHYAQQAAQRLSCSLDEIEPYVFMTITAVANYTLFAEDGIIAPQMKLVKHAITNIIHRQPRGDRKEGNAE